MGLGLQGSSWTSLLGGFAEDAGRGRSGRAGRTISHGGSCLDRGSCAARDDAAAQTSLCIGSAERRSRVLGVDHCDGGSGGGIVVVAAVAARRGARGDPGSVECSELGLELPSSHHGGLARALVVDIARAGRRDGVGHGGVGWGSFAFEEVLGARDGHGRIPVEQVAKERRGCLSRIVLRGRRRCGSRARWAVTSLFARRRRCGGLLGSAKRGGPQPTERSVHFGLERALGVVDKRVDLLLVGLEERMEVGGVDVVAPRVWGATSQMLKMRRIS